MTSNIFNFAAFSADIVPQSLYVPPSHKIEYAAMKFVFAYLERVIPMSGMNKAEHKRRVAAEANDAIEYPYALFQHYNAGIDKRYLKMGLNPLAVAVICGDAVTDLNSEEGRNDGIPASIADDAKAIWQEARLMEHMGLTGNDITMRPESVLLAHINFFTKLERLSKNFDDTTIAELGIFLEHHIPAGMTLADDETDIGCELIDHLEDMRERIEEIFNEAVDISQPRKKPVLMLVPPPEPQ